MHVGRHRGHTLRNRLLRLRRGHGHLGMRLGLQVLGRKEGATALDGLAFRTRPLYTGNPWFLAPSVRYFRWRDRQGS